MSDATGSPSPTDRFRTTTRGPLAPTGTPVEVPSARWDAITSDLTARGVTGDPELVSAKAVTWNNGALGCPTPGQSYTQAVIDGMQVIVRAGGADYDYRFGQSDKPVLCKR